MTEDPTEAGVSGLSPSGADTKAGRPGAARFSLLWPSVAMAIVFVVGKAILLGLPGDVTWGPRLVALTWQDALCATAYAVLGGLVLRLCAGRPTLERGAFLFLLLLGAVCVAYTIVHIGFYESFRRAINVQMLRFAGRFQDLRSSVMSRLTWPYVISLTTLPPLFVGVFGRLRGSPSPQAKAAVGMVVLLWVVAGQQLLHHSGAEWMERMAQNPHFVLLASVVTEFRGGGSVALPSRFSAADIEEFRPEAASSSAADLWPQPTGTNERKAAAQKRRIVRVLWAFMSFTIQSRGAPTASSNCAKADWTARRLSR